jgi:hypothetical protein
VALALWSFWYAAYRAYYALGGQVGMFGEPTSIPQWRQINAFGAAVIFLASIIPLLALRTNAVRRALPAIGWIAAVGCCMHALVDVTLRILSITGVHPTELPPSVWRSFDRQAADVQDLLLNEPWFFVEGVLWAALAIVRVDVSRRRAWMVSAIAMCVALAIAGVLSGVGAFEAGGPLR